MNRIRTIPGLAVTMLLVGMLATVALAAKKRVDPARYTGVSEDQAFDYLIGLARIEAEDGSWENIAIARTFMLAGRESEGEAIIDNLRGEREASDYIRMGRAYHAAGDWPKAKAAFDQVVALRPKDADWLAEIGAYYNVEGDRQKAEELFARSFELAPAVHKNLRDAAGSYLGVAPNR